MAACKATSHLWDETLVPFDRVDYGPGFVTVSWRCTRCTCLKWLAFDVHGQPAGHARYLHPEGYREAGRRPGVDRPTKRDWRAWHFADRFNPDGTATDAHSATV